uniref:DUF418 domain-containing protein n=1 Tax=uncultured bacterium fosmid pJB89E1 TaxID=1478073 RepID=A0A0H3U8B4_9BACT|nr:hypothetical protein [uncultured bacterium fosmid pJB89E1]
MEIPATKRIDLVDCIRGFAVCGIIMIHFQEHMNFISLPEPNALDKAIESIIFFLGASKMYGIFALLFGFSCYIQHHNQEKRGNDFRLRFAWRMVLLFLWGLLDLVFYNGDILCTYAAVGLLLIPFVKASDKVVLIAAAILFCQPVELVQIIGGAINPDFKALDLGLGKFWGMVMAPQAQGGFFDVAAANLKVGLQINFGWALEHGRLTQTYCLFLLGMYLGRKRLFLDEKNNLQFWTKAIVIAFVAGILIYPLETSLPKLIESRTVSASLGTLLTAWRNFCMMAFYVSALFILYYKTDFHKCIQPLACIGKISLTDYLIQSIVGGFLFYNWGLGLYRTCGLGYSFLMSVAFLVLLYFFCKWWTSHHRRGPLEEIWSRLTFIGAKK